MIKKETLDSGQLLMGIIDSINLRMWYILLMNFTEVFDGPLALPWIVCDCPRLAAAYVLCLHSDFGMQRLD